MAVRVRFLVFQESDMRNFMMFVGVAVAVAGCDMLESGASNAEEAAGEMAEAAEGAAEEAGEAAGAAAEAVEAAAENMGTKVADAIAGAGDHMGKDMMVAGNFVSTKVADGEDKVMVTLSAGTEEGAPTIACMVSKDNRSQFENMESQAMVQVKGTMMDKDGTPVLDDCTRTDMPAEAAEDAAEGEDGH